MHHQFPRFAKYDKFRKLFQFVLLLIELSFYFRFSNPAFFFAAFSEKLGIELSLFAPLANIKEAFSSWLDNFWFGIGDVSAFESNLLIAVAQKSGIFVLLILVFVIVLRLVHISEYSSFVSDSQTKIMTRMSALAVFAIICFGAFANVFSDITIYYLFLSVFGVLSATLRIAKKEADDRLEYYGDARSADSSIIDIRLRK